VLRCTFYGTVRTVTGSMHLLDAGDVRLLLDCGLFHGPRAQSYEINSTFPFPPSSLSAVLLFACPPRPLWQLILLRQVRMRRTIGGQVHG